MKTRFLLLMLTLISTFAFAQKGVPAYDISVSVTDGQTKEPIIMGTVQLNPLGQYAVTDVKGKAVIKNIPQGTYTLSVTYVGYETYTTNIAITNKNLDLNIRMSEASLALKEVSVTAKQNASGTSTASIIGRQAIDHLQASSLADIMQLVPGAEMGNVDLTNTQNTRLQLRSANKDVRDNNSAFGSPVIIDGVPISNNGYLTQGNFSNTDTGVGTDLRNISADDIEEVEVVRGIPSAEYGDLTSGMVVVHSKIGVTPWQVKAKINPALMNYSLGKGLRMNKYGILNFNVDYAQAWSDPRKKVNSFDRYTFSVGYGIDISRKWHTDTKIRYNYSKTWNGKDPDAIQDRQEEKNKNTSFSLTHNGKIRLDRFFSRNITYTFGISLTGQDSRKSRITESGLTPIITSTETGYYSLPWVDMPYFTTGYTESRPGNVYFKATNSFYVKSGKSNQNFKMGLEYKYDWNSGRGYYNEDETHPYKPNGDSRPRAFSDIPGLHQVAAFVEDNFSWQYSGKRYLRVQLGGRFTAMQPFSDVKTFAFSPRLNMNIDLTSWLALRGGIGVNSKTPGLNYLYPDRKYVDYIVANYMPQNDPVAQFLYGYTNVYNVEFSRDLKNVNTTKIEAGVDIKLPGQRKLSIIVYQDRTTNGFESFTEYNIYPVRYYTDGNNYQGLNITQGQPTTVNESNPVMILPTWTTTGRIGNTAVNINKGIEFDFDLGKIKPINTHIYLSGAWQDSRSYSKSLHYGDPSPLPTIYSARKNATPFKMVWPAERASSRYQKFITTMRLVTNVPQLRMVASFTGQVVLHNSSRSMTDYTRPNGWITSDNVYHPITDEMLGGFIGDDGVYYATAPTDQNSFAIAKQTSSSYSYSKNPVTWNVSARLTKEFGKYAGLSFYVNNVMYYEPFLSQSNNGTLTQRNTGTFSFGVELFLNL